MRPKPHVTEVTAGVKLSHPHLWDGHRVFKLEEGSVGLVAFVAIHSLRQCSWLGWPAALGGCRFKEYTSSEAAIADVLRLSRAMTYKAALAGVLFGGSKTVVLGNPKRLKTGDFLLALGAAIQEFNRVFRVGVVKTGEDMNITESDVAVMSHATAFVNGKPRFLSGSGNPAPFTALGVVEGIRVSLEHTLGPDDEPIAGRTFAVQGLGSVGLPVVHMLRERGAGHIWVSDLDESCMGKIIVGEERDAVSYLAPGSVGSLNGTEVFVPCAVGGFLNERVVAELRYKIVAGSANNQLADEKAGDLLHAYKILYAPDYCINAGGLINITHEDHPEGYNEARVREHILLIPQTLKKIFERSRAEDVPTYRVADQMAEEIIKASFIKP
ncbi:MAG: amino acid dehydrogenase [Parcubacteria group bacterium]|nr:amino acid dehydrogenase [Parcubacteria group bacterium]